jgi:hypothetical protein
MIQFPLRPSQPQSPFAQALQPVDYRQDLTAAVNQLAPQFGIDPQVALKVIGGEGGFSNPYQRGRGPAPRSQAPGLGRTENSYGPLQLYISGTGAGLGDRALAAGIDPRKDWRAGLKFGLQEVANKGWGQWYGARAQGITGFTGVNGRKGRTIANKGNGGGSPVGTVAAPDQPQSFGQQVADAVLGDSSIKSVGADKSSGGLQLGAPRQTAPAQLPEVAPAQKRDLSGLVEALSQGQTQPLASQPPEVRLRALAAYGQMV